MQYVCVYATVATFRHPKGGTVSQKVHVDTGQLRQSAKRLSEANEGRPTSPMAEGSLGAARAVGAFDEFHGYWDPALRAVSESVVSLTDALVSAADMYVRRDFDSARGFSFGAPRAF